MQFSTNDKEILSSEKNQQFINNCIDEFKDQPISIENRRKVQSLTIWSYLPNLVSVSTATFFIFYLLDSYSLYVKVGLSIILFLIAASLEIGKRSLISEAAKTYFKFSKINYLLVFGVCLLITISMAASYQGGNKLIVESASTPKIPVNHKIDSLAIEVAKIDKSITAQQQTKWKGNITRVANNNLKRLFIERSVLTKKINELDSLDQQAHNVSLSTHSAKIANFGVVLGLIAILADVVLLLMIITIKKLKYEVVVVSSSNTVNVSKAKIKTIQADSNSFSSNQATQPDRPRIGFKMPTNGQRKVSADSSKQRECLYCGELFTYKHWNAKYCSDKCRVAAWEKRTGKRLRKKSKINGR